MSRVNGAILIHFESFFLRWDLIEAKLGKEDTKHLKDNSLNVIDLCDQGISAELVEHLAKVLKSNSSLKEIYLSNNNHIGDKGWKYLAEALKVNNSLEKIELNDFGIKTEGAKCLVEVLKVNTSLKYILLRCNDLGDEGMKHLKEGLKVNRSVEEIQLDNNEIGEEGIKHLAEGLTGNTVLKKLTLEDNDIGEGGELLNEVYDLNFTYNCSKTVRLL